MNTLEELIQIWEESGLLETLSKSKKIITAFFLEKTCEYLVKNRNKYVEIETVVFPILRRITGNKDFSIYNFLLSLLYTN